MAEVPFAEEEEVLCWENDNHAKFAEGTSESHSLTDSTENRNSRDSGTKLGFRFDPMV